MTLYHRQTLKPAEKDVVELLETGTYLSIFEWSFSRISSRTPGLRMWYTPEYETHLPVKGARVVSPSILAIGYGETMGRLGRTFLLDEQKGLYYAVDAERRVLRRRELSPGERRVILCDVDKTLLHSYLYCGSVEGVLAELTEAGYGVVEEEYVLGAGFVVALAARS